MDSRKSQAAFSALAQPTRLKAFRRLVAAHPQGLPAGDIAAFCKVPHNTMSTHLAALMRGGLIAVTREGRSMNYRANLDGFRGLIDFMLRDCCGGRPEICAPVVQDFSAACAPAPKAAS
jgi:DNA-binding transcriptional ArsR family regulator